MTHCAGLTPPGRNPLPIRASVSGLAPWRVIGDDFSMAIASWSTRRVACVAGTGSKPGTSGPQPRELAAARRRAQQRADLAPRLPGPLGQLRVSARAGGHGRLRFTAGPAVAASDSAGPGFAGPTASLRPTGVNPGTTSSARTTRNSPRLGPVTSENRSASQTLHRSRSVSAQTQHADIPEPIRAMRDQRMRKGRAQ